MSSVQNKNLIDPRLEDIVCRIRAVSDPEKIVLYGSRARGENNPRSDFDIAVFGKVDMGKIWDNLTEAQTLLKIDVVVFDELSDSVFKDKILNEGIVIYEREILMAKPRVLSGIQPSGKLHLGNLIGAMENWVKMQFEYDCFFEIADLHALTTGYDNTKEFNNNVLDVAVDLLSAGIDPDKCTLFVQSEVPAHSELHLLLSMITPLPWLERVPTYKGKIDELKEKDLGTYGFLGYPVLQAADILLYKAERVPVGQDQLPHLELTREIARRFNFFYGETFPVPKEVLTSVPVLPGLDGRKMSKSYGNTIALSDPPDEVRKKVSSMLTDPARVKKSDVGHPAVCPVFAYHKIFNFAQTASLKSQCEAAQIGCVECKKLLAEVLVKRLSPLWEKRQKLIKDLDKLHQILQAGAERAGREAEATLRQARKAMGIR